MGIDTSLGPVVPARMETAWQRLRIERPQYAARLMAIVGDGITVEDRRATRGPDRRHYR